MSNDNSLENSVLSPATKPISHGHPSPSTPKYPIVSDSEDSDSGDDNGADNKPTLTLHHSESDSNSDDVPESLIVESPVTDASSAKAPLLGSVAPNTPKNPVWGTRTRFAQPAIQPSHSKQKRKYPNPRKSVVFDSSASIKHRPSNSSVLPTSNIPPPMFSQSGLKFGFPDVASKIGTVRGVANDYFVAASNALSSRPEPPVNLSMIDPKDRALWKWANVDHLDSFLREIYDYYLGKGFYCIILSRMLNMATILFVVAFSTYLTSCIDYSKISSSSRLSQVQYPHCAATRLSSFSTFLLWLFALFWFLKVVQYIHDIKRLFDLKQFCFHLLNITDAEMQTISWQQVVERLMLLREQNPQTANVSAKSARFLGNNTQLQKLMGPQGIANRIMRKENYMIAMVNKNILDISIPSPFKTTLPFFPFDRKPFLTRTLEWNLSLCIMDFVFSNDEIRPAFLKETNRKKLSDALRRRFILAGFINIACVPITVVYMTILYFFRYFNEYHKDPSSIGTRQYTPLAEWKMREFNELHHMFQRRLRLSYDPASKYVNQFPKEKTVIFSRFVVFVCGSFAAVLGVISLIDPEMFLGFEISKDRTVLFYIGLFGSILAVARGMIPDASELFMFDPETSLRSVVEYTHYMPDEWAGRYHTDEVKNEFSEMYDLKIMIIFRELLSVIVTPFILWLSLSRSAEKVVDFFREFSVHVDGLGYVCTFATFDFSLNGKRGAAKNNLAKLRANTYNESDIERELDEDEDDEDALLTRAYHSTADGKMLKSYLNFLENYGDGTENSNLNLDNGLDGSTISTVSHRMHYSNRWGPSSTMYDRRGLPTSIRPEGASMYSSGPEATKSVHFYGMENSVMGRFNRIQQHRNGTVSGTATPLARSGILEFSVHGSGSAVSATAGPKFGTRATFDGELGKVSLRTNQRRVDQVFSPIGLSGAPTTKERPKRGVYQSILARKLHPAESFQLGNVENSVSDSEPVPKGVFETSTYGPESSLFSNPDGDEPNKEWVKDDLEDNQSESEEIDPGKGVLGLLD